MGVSQACMSATHTGKVAAMSEPTKREWEIADSFARDMREQLAERLATETAALIASERERILAVFWDVVAGLEKAAFVREGISSHEYERCMVAAEMCVTIRAAIRKVEGGEA